MHAKEKVRKGEGGSAREMAGDSGGSEGEGTRGRGCGCIVVMMMSLRSSCHDRRGIVVVAVSRISREGGPGERAARCRVVTSSGASNLQGWEKINKQVSEGEALRHEQGPNEAQRSFWLSRLELRGGIEETYYDLQTGLLDRYCTRKVLPEVTCSYYNSHVT